MNYFLKQIIDFIDSEADAQNEQIDELWAKPLKERVSEGEAIDNIEIVEMRGFGMKNFDRDRYYDIRNLRCVENFSKFRVGDQLRLHKGNPNSETAYVCKILKDGGSELMVQPGFRENFYGLRAGDGWILDRDKIDIRHVLKSAMFALGNSFQKTRIIEILQSKVKPNIDHSKIEKAKHYGEKFGLNSSQVEGLSKAYATKNFYLIQGPPGTGKTFVLSYLAQLLAQEGERVLITALSHRAINNALRKVGEITGYEKVIKIGQDYNSSGLVWKNGHIPNFEKYRDSPFSSRSKGIIVGSTCLALHTSRLKNVVFDTIIFDEAGQLTLPMAIAGMIRAKRYIFIGDHQQMSPIIVGEYEEEMIKKSVFEHLFLQAPGTMLNITYRMNEVINRFPSTHFYNGQLQPAASARHRLLSIDYSSKKYPKILNPEYSDIFVDLKHKNGTIRCLQEAKAIADMIVEAISCGVPAAEIAVIAPFRAQGRMISNLLWERLDTEDVQAIVTDTVERIQGQERDLIFISLTTSDMAFAASSATFYFQPNRLNVALTRPRVKRIVVGSSHLFDTAVKDEGLKKWIDNFKAFYESCELIVDDKLV